MCQDFGPLKVIEMGKMLAVMTKFRNVCAHNDRLVLAFEQKNRTPSQRRPYKNAMRFYDSGIIICRLLQIVNMFTSQFSDIIFKKMIR